MLSCKVWCFWYFYVELDCMDFLSYVNWKDALLIELVSVSYRKVCLMEQWISILVVRMYVCVFQFNLFIRGLSTLWGRCWALMVCICVQKEASWGFCIKKKITLPSITCYLVDRSSFTKYLVLWWIAIHFWGFFMLSLFCPLIFSCAHIDKFKLVGLLSLYFCPWVIYF